MRKLIRRLSNFYDAFVYAMSVLAAQDDDDELTEAEYLEECYNLDSFHPTERNWR